MDLKEDISKIDSKDDKDKSSFLSEINKIN